MCRGGGGFGWRGVERNDNDFLAQDGFQVGAPYKADDGANVDTMFLVYQVTLPGLAKK